VDIAILGENSIKIKGKQVSFVVDPMRGMTKTPSDGVILFDDKIEADPSRVDGYRIIISGPGEYEIGKAKITGIRTPKGMFYKLFIDGISVVLGFAMDAKMEGFDECGIAIIKTNDDFNEAFVTGLEPKMAVLYGNKKIDAAKKLGVENTSLVPKITITKDKLQEKMEIVVLG
jgi:hypothetical protein